jgi:hypothetical protein
MKTRSIMREIGFYRNLNDPSVLKNNFNECKAKKNEVKTHKKVFALEYKFLRIEINSQMIRLLKFSGGSKYSSPNVTIQIHISEKLYRHFKDKFEITGRFKANGNFETEFVEEKMRYFIDRKTAFGEFFKFKITKFKDIQTYDKNLNLKVIQRNCLFSMSFLRDKY